MKCYLNANKPTTVKTLGMSGQKKFTKRAEICGILGRFTMLSSSHVNGKCTCFHHAVSEVAHSEVFPNFLTAETLSDLHNPQYQKKQSNADICYSEHEHQIQGLLF